MLERCRDLACRRSRIVTGWRGTDRALSVTFLREIRCGAPAAVRARRIRRCAGPAPTRHRRQPYTRRRGMVIDTARAGSPVHLASSGFLYHERPGAGDRRGGASCGAGRERRQRRSPYSVHRAGCRIYPAAHIHRTRRPDMPHLRRAGQSEFTRRAARSTARAIPADAIASSAAWRSAHSSSRPARAAAH